MTKKEGRHHHHIIVQFVVKLKHGTEAKLTSADVIRDINATSSRKQAHFFCLAAQQLIYEALLLTIRNPFNARSVSLGQKLAAF